MNRDRLFALLIGLLAFCPAASHAQAPWQKEQAKLDAQFITELQTVRPFARGAMPHEKNCEGPRDGSAPIVLEAAGEFCRQKGLNGIGEGLPQIAERYRVVYSGLLPPLPGTFDQDWVVLYRDDGVGADDTSLRIWMVVLRPADGGPQPKTEKERDAYKPVVRALAPKGFHAIHSLVWWTMEEAELALEVFEQGRPFGAKGSWYHQTVAMYRVRSSGFKRLSLEGGMLHPLNFVPTHDLAKFIENGRMSGAPLMRAVEKAAEK